MNKKIVIGAVVLVLALFAGLFSSGTLSQGRLTRFASSDKPVSYMKPYCLTPEEWYEKYVKPFENETKEGLSENTEGGEEGEGKIIVPGGTKGGGDGSKSSGRSGGSADPHRSGGTTTEGGSNEEGESTTDKPVVIATPGLIGSTGNTGGTVKSGDRSGSSSNPPYSAEGSPTPSELQKSYVDCGCKRQGFEWKKFDEVANKEITFVCMQKLAYECAKPEWQCPEGTNLDLNKIRNECKDLKKTICKNEVASFVAKFDKNKETLCKLYQPYILGVDCYQPYECEEYPKNDGDKGMYMSAVAKMKKAGYVEGTAAFNQALDKEMAKASACNIIYGN